MKLYSTETEESLIGCLFHANDAELDDIFENVQAEHFHDKSNQLLFTGAELIYTKGLKIDFSSMTTFFERKDWLNGIGGMSKLSNICAASPGAMNYQAYVKTVVDYARLREYEQAGNQIAILAASGKNAETVQAEAEKILAEIGEKEQKSTVEKLAVAVESEKKRIDDLKEGKHNDFGIPTGYPNLDKILWGFQKSDFIIIAARPGQGKTAFAVNVMNHTSATLRKKVLFFSLEMPKVQIARRFIANRSKVSNEVLKSGRGITGKEKAIDNTISQLIGSEVYIDDKTKKVSEMRIKAKRMKRQYGLDYIVVDYLQFIKPERTMDRFQAVGEITRELKSMARELDVPVVALAQLNRENEKDNKKPTLANLRESGEIEQTADLVMFLWSKKEAGQDKQSYTKDIWLCIEKHRNGVLRDIQFVYQGDTFTFTEKDKPPETVYEQARIEEPEPPFGWRD